MSKGRFPLKLIVPASRCLLLAGGVALLIAADVAPYTNDFEKAQVGKVPEDIMVLDGTFAVRSVDGNKCLELAGDPVGSFGALFGPDGLVAMDVKARIWSAAAGKRFPEAGIGADDAGGYKLFTVPARHLLQLRKGDDPVASAPFQWQTAKWIWYRLRVEPQDAKTWQIRGKAWPEGQKEPENWTVVAHDTETPSAGRASLWGSDFSEQPIRFDDLSVEKAK
jgi:hypothetical protein